MSSSSRRISLNEQQAARKVRAPAPRIKDLLPADHASRMPTEEEKEKLLGACIKFCNYYPQLSYVTCPETSTMLCRRSKISLPVSTTFQKNSHLTCPSLVYRAERFLAITSFVWPPEITSKV